MRAMVPIGRALFALIFITSVFSDFSSSTIAAASAHGVPLAVVLVPLAGILAFGCGVVVPPGLHPPLGAFPLVLLPRPVTLGLAKVWGLSGSPQGMWQRV